MSEYEKKEKDGMIEYSYEDVYLGVFDGKHEFAEVRVLTYPDGSPINHLSSGHLRELAQMLEDAADELEE